MSWIKSEPVLTRIGALSAIAVAFLTAKGLLSQEDAYYAMAALTALFGAAAVVVTRPATAAVSKAGGEYHVVSKAPVNGNVDLAPGLETVVPDEPFIEPQVPEETTLAKRTRRAAK